MTFKKHEKTTQDGKKFNIIEVIFDDKAMLKSLEQSYLKSKYTRDENQNGDIRVKSKKFDKQLEGILGEIAVLEFIKLIFKKENEGCEIEVSRYDDVRTDNFTSPDNEYDIKITNTNANKDHYIEVRASINYKFNFNEKTLELFDTIGKYDSPIKQQETSSDFYIRPLFQLLYPSPDIKIENIPVLECLLDEKIVLYITGGCNRDMMFGDKSKVKPMGQNRTNYQTLSIENGWDMKELSENIRLAVCGANDEWTKWTKASLQ